MLAGGNVAQDEEMHSDEEVLRMFMANGSCDWCCAPKMLTMDCPTASVVMTRKESLSAKSLKAVRDFREMVEWACLRTQR